MTIDFGTPQNLIYLKATGTRWSQHFSARIAIHCYLTHSINPLIDKSQGKIKA